MSSQLTRLRYSHPHSVVLQYSELRIKSRVVDLGRKIAAYYPADEPLHVVAVMNGGICFAADLLRHIPRPCTFGTIRAHSYPQGVQSNVVQLSGWEPVAYNGSHVLFVEDIVDSGATVAAILDNCGGMGALSVEFATMVLRGDDPKGARWIGHRHHGPEFLFGYGMDKADGTGRGLRSIYA